MRGITGILVTAIAGLLLSDSARADFADGARAYDAGDYTTAYEEWQPLAEGGNSAAQVAIASLYRSGLGRPVDLVRSAHWYRRAAAAGDGVAQLNLGEMYQHGWGVARDAVRAFIWYDRAAAQGRDWAAERRDKLAKRMTAAELKAAHNQIAR